MKAFLGAAVLVATGCAHAPPTTPSVEFSADSSRPLLVDVNGDGTPDLVVRATNREGYVAVDGATGRELWRTQPTKDHDARFAYVASGRLVSVGEYVANVFDLSSGAAIRAVDLEGTIEIPCEAPAGRARLLRSDGSALTFDTETGETTTEPADAQCTEVRTDSAERREVIERHYRPVEHLPAGMPAVRCGKWSVEHIGSGESFEVPDPCADIGIPADADMVPKMIVKTDRGDLVLGSKRRGHPRPALALVADGKMIWSSSPPVESDGAPDRIAFDRGAVALLFNDAHGQRLFSWDIATGTPILDVSLTSQAKWIDVAPSGWLVTGSSTAIVVNESSGALHPLFGPREKAEPEWSPGNPVPVGYVAETHHTPDGKLIGAGVGVFGGTMTLNAILYGALDDPKHLWPLLVPGVGPFILLGTVPHADQGLVYVMAIDWAAQSTGIIWIAIGAAEKKTSIAPIRPVVGIGTIGIQGSF